MKKFKKILYYGSVILPIFNKISSIIKLIVDLNQSNKEVIQARNDIFELIQETKESIDEFNKTMED